MLCTQLKKIKIIILWVSRHKSHSVVIYAALLRLWVAIAESLWFKFVSNL